MQATERVSYRAYAAPSTLRPDVREKRAGSVFKRLSKEDRRSLSKSGGLDFDKGKVLHVSRWTSDMSGHWHFEKYLGEWPSEEAVRAILPTAEFTG